MTKQRSKKRNVKLTPRDLRILESMKDNSWKEGCSSPREMVERATDVRGVGRLSMWMKTRVLPLTPEDYKRIVLLCTDAIVKKRHSNRSDRAQVDVLLPFNFRVMCPDFPRGYLMDVPDVLTVKYRVNANALLDYVYEKGYSSYSSRHLKHQLGVVNRYFNSLTSMFEEDEELDEYTKMLLQYGSDGEVESFIGRVLNKGEK